MATKEEIRQQTERLHQKLKELRWPQKYMFKFVVPTDSNKIDRAVELLPTNGTLTFNNSRSGKYTSITCVATMPSAEAVTQILTQASEIEGLISL